MIKWYDQLSRNVVIQEQEVTFLKKNYHRWLQQPKKDICRCRRINNTQRNVTQFKWNRVKILSAEKGEFDDCLLERKHNMKMTCGMQLLHHNYNTNNIISIKDVLYFKKKHSNTFISFKNLEMIYVQKSVNYSLEGKNNGKDALFKYTNHFQWGDVCHLSCPHYSYSSSNKPYLLSLVMFASIYSLFITHFHRVG